MNNHPPGRVIFARDLRRLRAELPSIRQGATPQAVEDSRLHALIQHSPSLITILDATGRLTYVSPPVEPLLGFQPEELLAHHGFDLLHPDDLPAAQAALAAVARRPGERMQMEMRLRHKEGHWRRFEVRGTNLLDHPFVQGIVVNARDITEQRATEERLRHTLRQLEVILDGVADGITAQNPTGALIYANEAAAQLIGYPSVEALLAAPLAELGSRFEVFDEMGEPLPLTQLPGRRALLGENPPDTLLRFRLRATGEERWSLVKARPIFDEQGQVQMAVNIFRDVTERKQVEREQQFLAGASATLASSLDYETTLNQVAQSTIPELADSCVLYVADPLGIEDARLRPMAVAHRNPARLAIARQIQEQYFIDPQQVPGLSHVLQSGQSLLIPRIDEAMRAASAQDEHHRALLHELGTCAAIIVPLRATQHTLGLLILTMDESGRHYSTRMLNLAEALAQRAATALEHAHLYREAQAAIQLRDQFLSIAAHELRTPLTSVQGYVDLLRRRIEREPELGGAMGSSVAVLQQETRRLGRLIDLLLNVSRLQQGRLPLDTQRLDFAALVARVVDVMQPTLTAHTLHLLSPGIPLLVSGDDIRLEQVLHNLLGNAIKYMPEGGAIQIKLSAEATWVQLIVTDEGIGIPAEAMEHLFTPFYRAANAQERGIAGMGLGLYLAREIIQRHQGTLEMTSSPGQGTTVRVQLPRLNSPGQP